MKETSLVDLVCPALPAGKRCQGHLTLHDVLLPVQRAPGDSTETIEGILVCQSCGAEYPIIAGVLMLVGDIKTYLAQHASEIVRLGASSISAPMMAYLQHVGANLHESGSPRSDWVNALGISLYISAHYDQLASLVDPSHPFAEFLHNYARRDLYAQLMDLVEPALGPEKQVLDIGCHVGGMSWRLAHACKFVYGIDLSFRAALTARRILLGYPEPLRRYRWYDEGMDYTERDLAIARRENLEILVASGMELPFVDATFHVVTCANVVDVVDHPTGLLRESLRTLTRGGHLLQTYPYFWEFIRTPPEQWLGNKPYGVLGRAVRAYLQETCDIVDEKDEVMWTLRIYDRLFGLGLNDCILAKKEKLTA